MEGGVEGEREWGRGGGLGDGGWGRVLSAIPGGVGGASWQRAAQGAARPSRMRAAALTRQAEAGATEAEMDRLLREVRAIYWSKY